jgi:hypothetical protein
MQKVLFNQGKMPKPAGIHSSQISIDFEDRREKPKVLWIQVSDRRETPR